MIDERMTAMGGAGGGIGTDQALDEALGPMPEAPEVDPEVAFEEQRQGAITAAAMDKPKEPVEPGVVRVVGTLVAKILEATAAGELPVPEVQSTAAAFSDELYANLRGLAGLLTELEPARGAALDKALDIPGTVGGEQVIDVLTSIVTNEELLGRMSGAGGEAMDGTPEHELAEPVEEPAETDDDELIALGG